MVFTEFLCYISPILSNSTARSILPAPAIVSGAGISIKMGPFCVLLYYNHPMPLPKPHLAGLLERIQYWIQKPNHIIDQMYIVGSSWCLLCRTWPRDLQGMSHKEPSDLRQATLWPWCDLYWSALWWHTVHLSIVLRPLSTNTAGKRARMYK